MATKNEAVEYLQKSKFSPKLAAYYMNEINNCKGNPQDLAIVIDAIKLARRMNKNFSKLGQLIGEGSLQISNLQRSVSIDAEELKKLTK